MGNLPGMVYAGIFDSLVYELLRHGCILMKSLLKEICMADMLGPGLRRMAAQFQGPLFCVAVKRTKHYL